MDVNEAGRDDQTARIDLTLGSSGQHPFDGDDLVAIDGDVGVEPRIAGAVNDLRAVDEYVNAACCHFFAALAFVACSVVYIVCSSLALSKLSISACICA